MAVRAPDLALGDLGRAHLPTDMAVQQLRHTEVLVAQVIELEDYRVRFPAIDAWVVEEELVDASLVLIIGPPHPCRSASSTGICVVGVVPDRSSDVALPTSALSAVATGPVEVERFERLHLPAGRTPPTAVEREQSIGHALVRLSGGRMTGSVRRCRGVTQG